MAIFCCLARHDTNVIGASFLLLGIATYYKRQPSLMHKLIVQILLLLTLIDVFWIFLIGGVWEHNEKDTEFWGSLSLIHTLVKVGAYVEIILSLTIVGILFVDYKQTYNTVLNPLNFKYNDVSKNGPMMNY